MRARRERFERILDSLEVGHESLLHNESGPGDTTDEDEHQSENQEKDPPVAEVFARRSVVGLRLRH